MSGSEDDYKIGKGRPPKSKRFLPGQSGNPKGRPKGRRNFATEIEEILTAPVPISENGCRRNVTSRMAALMKLRKKALEGDGRALDRYLELATAHAADEAAAAAERKLSAVEGEILARYVESCAGQGSEYPKDGATSAEARDDQPR
jgi:hypothetical protein